MIIMLITIGLMVGTAFLARDSKNKKTTLSYFFVLIGGLVTFLFEPLIIALFTDGSVDGGAIQIASTIIGLYFIIWSISQMIKKQDKSEIDSKK